MTAASTPHVAANDDNQRSSVVIMVHGTFAAAEDDCGERWWQSGSPVALQLQSLVPASTQLADGSEVFHWSGENSDRARSKAGVQLLRHIQRLEEEGCDYHLVGHSHGGSVIWNALQRSVLRRRPLQRLRSWTTVGTPFMQLRSPGVMRAKTLLGLIVGLVLLLPAMGAPSLLVRTLYNITFDNRTGVILESHDKASFANVLQAPILALVECFGIAVHSQPDGVQVGSFDPNGNQTLAAYFFATPEGLFLLILMMGMSYFFLHCAALCLAPAVESLRMRFEQRLRQRAFELYGARWLGLWSPDDEAINGLRSTLQISVSFVRKIVPREVVYLSDILTLLSRPYYWLFAPLYNRFIHPAIDGKIRDIVVRSAQGSDRPGTMLIDVVPYPLATESFSPPPLPALLNVKLLSFANRHAHELVPKLRNLIAQTSFTSGLETFGKQLSGKELVHTAYFELEEVLKLIAANIHWETANAGKNHSLDRMPTWLRKWFIGFKQATSSDPYEVPVQGDGATQPPRLKAG